MPRARFLNLGITITELSDLSACHTLAQEGSAMLRFGLLFFAVLIEVALAPPAGAAKRVALVIGNGAYAQAGTLTNPVNDATDMANALKRFGFDVILGLDLDRRRFDEK